MPPTFHAPEVNPPLTGADRADVKTTESDATLREFVPWQEIRPLIRWLPSAVQDLSLVGPFGATAILLLVAAYWGLFAGDGCLMAEEQVRMTAVTFTTIGGRSR